MSDEEFSKWCKKTMWNSLINFTSDQKLWIELRLARIQGPSIYKKCGGII